MAKFVNGDVVVVPFPFSDLTQAKRRPALVMAGVDGDDLILCQITSQTVRDNYAVPITDADFTTSGLKQMSNIRPNRIFTADSHIVLYKTGSLNAGKIVEVVNSVVNIIKS